jgi:predicted RNase H-like nuclease (RuvC/YqgF family)
MKDSKLRKLSRKELLQILVTQSKRIEELEAKLDEAERELDDHMLIMKEAGTMAEAALRLNHIFEDADAACQQYLKSIKAMAEREQAQHRGEGVP